MAAVVDTAKYRGKIAVTALGTPNEMKKYVGDGTVKEFVRWNPANLGYLAACAAVEIASGQITGATGPWRITARSALAPKIGCRTDQIRSLAAPSNSTVVITARSAPRSNT